jgi:hypothetical protein
MAYLTNANTASEFRLFISGENSTRIQNLTDNLEQIYSNDDSWDDIQNSLSILLKAANERLLVADAGGVIVGDTGDDWLGRDTDQMGLENGTAVTVSSGKVGEFYLLTSGSGSGMGHMGGRAPPCSLLPKKISWNRSIALCGRPPSLRRR